MFCYKNIFQEYKVSFNLFILLIIVSFPLTYLRLFYCECIYLIHMFFSETP